MSDDNKPSIITEPNTDLTSQEVALVDKYVLEGMPGLASVDQVKMGRILDMYLSGHTYRKISMTVSVPKQIVLYLSYKFDWFKMRQEHMIELEANMRDRVLESHIVSQDFLLQLIQFFQKKIGANLSKYMATDNLDYANAIDLKEIDRLLKTIEKLQKMGPSKGPRTGVPAVGLNLGDGVTVERKDDNTVEITPKSKAAGDMLKQLADLRRETEDK